MQLEPRAAAHSPSALGLCLRVSCWHRCSAVGDGCCRVTVSGGHVWPAEKPLAGLFTKQKLHFSSSNSSAARGVRRHLAKKIWRNSVVPGTWRYLSLSVGQDNLVLLPCALARAWCRQRWWHVKTLFRPRLTTSWPPPPLLYSRNCLKNHEYLTTLSMNFPPPVKTLFKPWILTYCGAPPFDEHNWFLLYSP